jgi:hypothetical protein
MKKLVVLLAFARLALPQAAGVGSIWTFLGPTTLQNAATATGNGSNMAVGGMSSAIFSVNCSVSCSGGTTVNFEASDATTNWAPLLAVQVGTTNIASSVANQASGTVTFWQVPVGAFQNIRARISGYSAGTVTVTATASAAPYDPKTLNSNLFLGGTAVSVGQQVAGSSVPVILPSATVTTLTPPSSVTVTQGTGTNLHVDVDTALPAGTNVIGHTINDTGSTTAVTGNVAVTKADASDVTLGAKADAKSTATDTTAVSVMQVLKEISAMEQAPASQAVTNAGTFATQSAATVADGADVTLGAKADAKNTATDTTAVSAISLLKEISAMEQAPASRAVTNTGTFATQSAATVADGSDVTQGAKADAKSTATDTTAVSIMSVLKEISAMEQTPASRAVTNAGTFAVQSAATLNAETTKVIGTVRALGNGGATLDSAPQATAPTNVLAVGAAAVNAEQTAATNGQAQRIVTDLVGKLIELPYANPENYVQGATTAQTGSTVVSVIASAGGSLRNYITSCQVTNTSSTNTFMQITDGASTVMATIPMPANGGAVVTFPSPLKGTAATATEALPGAAVTSWYVSCQGYKGL